MNTLPRLRATERIAVAYLDHLGAGPPTRVTVQGLCQHSGVHRTSFYRLFRDVADLDTRALGLYFANTVGLRCARPSTETELAGYYRAVVDAMALHPVFFDELYVRPWLQPYRSRWADLVAEWGHGGLGTPVNNPALVPLFQHFGRGVVDRFLEMAHRGTPSYPLAELTRVLVHYLAGGAGKVADEDARGRWERTSE